MKTSAIVSEKGQVTIPKKLRVRLGLSARTGLVEGARRGMITALDSSVLLDILLEDPLHQDSSLSALVAAHAAGVLVVCLVVWSEVRAALREPDRIGEHLGAAGIRFDPSRP